MFFEYAFDTAQLAHGEGLKNIFVTNGYMTEEATRTIAPYLDAANVDLKSFSDEFYRTECGGRLDPVLRTIEDLVHRKIWVELTTLVIPGKNDSDEELIQIARFIASLSHDIPWHVSRFHPDYKVLETEPTPRQTMTRALRIGRDAGLTSVHLGNM